MRPSRPQVCSRRIRTRVDAACAGRAAWAGRAAAAARLVGRGVCCVGYGELASCCALGSACALKCSEVALLAAPQRLECSRWHCPQAAAAVSAMPAAQAAAQWLQIKTWLAALLLFRSSDWLLHCGANRHSSAPALQQGLLRSVLRQWWRDSQAMQTARAGGTELLNV